MPNKQDTIKLLHSQEMRDLFSCLYGKEDQIIQEQIERYTQIVEKYIKKFPDSDIQLFSTPGRAELGGNHTDHNGGVVLASCVNLDSVAAAAKTDNHTITIYSEGYPNPFTVTLSDLEVKKDKQRTTTALIKGVTARFKDLEYSVGGFNAWIYSDVKVGSGLSSSASIEVLICTIINTFYNEGKVPEETLAQIGQYAENVYFGKPSGLMDQLTSAVGGIVFIDFKDAQKPVVKKVHFDINSLDYKLVVVDTGSNHSDLTEEYASVAEEMRSVARILGGEVLRDIELHDVFGQIQTLRSKVGDRAILRAFHFFADNRRVFEQVAALEKSDFDAFLRLVNDSGVSSCRWLQNCYTEKSPTEQGIPLALMLTENYLKGSGKGACRVHGGGYAGTILVFMPDGLLDNYIKLMEAVFGKGSVMVLNIRPYGSLHVNSVL